MNPNTKNRPRRSPRGRGLHKATLALAAAALLGVAAAGAQAAPLDDLRALVESSQFDKAYALAQTQPQLMGNPHFDFLYGVAAISVGRVSEGLLALERHLAAVPANDRARLELARGYFLLGEYNRARAEFEFVLRYNPPAGVRANIAGFLQAMQTREAITGTTAAGLYLEIGGGHDSNVNVGTYHPQIQVGAQPVTLTGTPSIQVRDDQSVLAAGFRREMRVSNSFGLFGGADVDARANAKASQYDITTGTGYVGFTQLSGRSMWRSTLSAEALLIGGNRYRDTLSVNVEDSLTLGQELSLQLFARFAQQRFDRRNEELGSNVGTLGGMVMQAFPNTFMAPSVGARLSYAKEKSTRLRDDLSNDTSTLRLFGGVTPMEGLRVTFSAVAYLKQFEGEDVGFGTRRRDVSKGLETQLLWSITPSWSARADAAWTLVQSNQDLYDSKRKSLTLRLRYQY